MAKTASTARTARAKATPGATSTRLQLAQDAAADELLSRDPLALLIGMVLDQQVPLERAFAGPRTIADRMGVDTLDALAIAEADPEQFAALCTGPPAVHRFPGSMAKRIQAAAAHVRDVYDGDVAALWGTAATGAELRKRLEAVPGFGAQKAKIFLALLGKQLGVRPSGWRAEAGEYGPEGTRRSVADITDAASLQEVRATKKEMKLAAKRAAATSTT